MNSEILKHIDAALVEFSGKEFFDDLVRAKQEFARLTGVIDDEDKNTKVAWILLIFGISSTTRIARRQL